MIYDETFIYAVCAVQEKYGPDKAQMLFNRLFSDVFGNITPVAMPSPPQAVWVGMGQEFIMNSFQTDVNAAAGEPIALFWIKKTAEKVGLPSQVNGVTWIKAFREVSGVGLYAAKHTMEYVRSHEAEWSAIINHI